MMIRATLIISGDVQGAGYDLQRRLRHWGLDWSLEGARLLRREK